MALALASASPPPPIACYVHFYSDEPNLTAYELPSPNAKNAIIAIGGLTDGPHTVGFFLTTSAHLAATQPIWSLFEIRISSSFTGFGHGSLDRDVSEIAKLVKYLRDMGKEKIVLLGHSTGSQDCIHYALKAQAEQPVDGFIMQGPCSDRQWIQGSLPPDQLSESLKLATDMISHGKAQEMMPRLTSSMSFMPPLTAYRFHSLAAVGGDDDYFSTDLPDDQLRSTFGKLHKPTLILHSANDESVDPAVDKTALIKKWASFAPEGVVSDLSGEVPGAEHQIKQPEARVWFAETVEKFLKGNF